MGFFAWRSFHHRDGRHAQKLRSCVHFQHIQGVTTDLCCVPLGFVIFVNDQTLTNYPKLSELLSQKNPVESRAILGLECASCGRNRSMYVMWSLRVSKVPENFLSEWLLMHPNILKLIHLLFFFEKGIKFSRVPHLPKISHTHTHWKTHLVKVPVIEMNMTWLWPQLTNLTIFSSVFGGDREWQEEGPCEKQSCGSFLFWVDFLSVEKHGFVCCNMLGVVKHRLLRGDRHFIFFFV